LDLAFEHHYILTSLETEDNKWLPLYFTDNSKAYKPIKLGLNSYMVLLDC